MLLTAQSQVKLWRTTLMHWVGTRGLPDVKGLPLPELGNACQKASLAPLAHASSVASMSATAAVQMAEAQLDVARAGLDLAKAQLRPPLSVSGSVGRTMVIGAHRAAANRVEASVTLTFSLPLYRSHRVA